MLPTPKVRQDRISSCILDLSENGIDLIRSDASSVAQVVRQHLDYFQLMLGYDSDPAEVLELIRQRAASIG